MIHWQYATLTPPQDIEELKTILLTHRGLETKKAQEEFFHPTHPLKIGLKDVELSEAAVKAAVERILLAKERQEEVVIFGDYDADGVCATAILWEALREVGIIAKPFLPHREKHGYGLSMRSLAAVLEEHKPQLLITVDNGIVAHDAFAELEKLGIDTILTDHHQPEAELPSAKIIVHSRKICGSGVAWFLARALSEKSAIESLELAGLATVADQMQLQGVNRSFVVHGMEALSKTPRVGLQLLMAKANVDKNKISTDTLNYVLAPRINAMGRLKHSLDALRLVCTSSWDRANELVNELNTTNSARQDLTVEMIEHALEQAESWRDEHIIIVADHEYHEGVIGLLAGKLMEQFHKPAIAIAISAKVAKASARSITGVNITEFIRLVREDLLEAGGHPMAAGFAVLPEKVELVKQKMQELARKQISKEALQPRLEVECSLPVELLNVQTAEMIQSFAPFGQGNAEPILSTPKGQVLAAGQIGKGSRHLKVELGFQTEQKMLTLSCLAWGQGERVEEFPVGAQVEAAGCLSINEWKNRKSLQMVVKDIRPVD